MYLNCFTYNKLLFLHFVVTLYCTTSFQNKRNFASILHLLFTLCSNLSLCWKDTILRLFQVVMINLEWLWMITNFCWIEVHIRVLVWLIIDGITAKVQSMLKVNFRRKPLCHYSSWIILSTVYNLASVLYYKYVESGTIFEYLTKNEKKKDGIKQIVEWRTR